MTEQFHVCWILWFKSLFIFILLLFIVTVCLKSGLLCIGGTKHPVLPTRSLEKLWSLEPSRSWGKDPDGALLCEELVGSQANMIFTSGKIQADSGRPVTTCIWASPHSMQSLYHLKYSLSGKLVRMHFLCKSAGVMNTEYLDLGIRQRRGVIRWNW